MNMPVNPLRRALSYADRGMELAARAKAPAMGLVNDIISRGGLSKSGLGWSAAMGGGAGALEGAGEGYASDGRFSPGLMMRRAALGAGLGVGADIGRGIYRSGSAGVLGGHLATARTAAGRFGNRQMTKALLSEQYANPRLARKFTGVNWNGR